MLKKLIVSFAVAASTLCPVFSDAAPAKDPLQGPVTVWHPFEPTPYDALSHVYNQQMGKILGQKFLFEYGMMGKAAKAVLNNAPDGKNMFWAFLGPIALKPNAVAPIYEPKDFRCVARTSVMPIILVAGKDAPYKSFEEFIEYAKANPGKSSVGITNFPSSLHLGMTHFEKIAGIDVKLVEQPEGPIRGAIDCLIGYTDALITHPPDIMRYILRGDVIPLATFNAERLEMLPYVPTIREFGYDFDQTSWRILVVHKDTPDAIVNALAEATKKALETPEMKKSAFDNFEPLAYLGPEETTAFLQKEFDFYKDLTMKYGFHWSQKKKK